MAKRGRKRHTSEGNILTYSGFARRCHRDKSNVSRGIALGKIIPRDDGRVDITHPTNREYMFAALVDSALHAGSKIEAIRETLNKS